MREAKYFLCPCAATVDYNKVLEEMTDVSIFAYTAVPFELHKIEEVGKNIVDEIAGYVGVTPYKRGSDYCTIIFALYLEYENINTFIGVGPSIAYLARAMGHDKILAHVDSTVAELLHRCGWKCVDRKQGVYTMQCSVDEVGCGVLGAMGTGDNNVVRSKSTGKLHEIKL